MVTDSLFRHKEMDTWKGRLIDKSPLTDRIWNIDPAGHEEGLVLLLLLVFAFFLFGCGGQTHACKSIFYLAKANTDI